MNDSSCGREPNIVPRIIRFRNAPAYLGMDRARFNAEVRPHLTEIPIGKQGIGFDRLELDAWVDAYKAFKDRRGCKIRRSDARNSGLATGWCLYKRQLSEHLSNPRLEDAREVCSRRSWKGNGQAQQFCTVA
jgi:hypothetical protein